MLQCSGKSTRLQHAVFILRVNVETICCRFIGMNDYQHRAADAIRAFKSETGHTDASLAAVLGIATGTFSAKIQCRRKFSAGELNQLAALGVQLPAFGEVAA